MIFLVTPSENVLEVNIYDDLEQITYGIDWQDVFEGKLTILDEKGNSYTWDTAKWDEYGTTQGYTLKVVGSNYTLLEQCKKAYERLGKPDEFKINKYEEE